MVAVRTGRGGVAHDTDRDGGSTLGFGRRLLVSDAETPAMTAPDALPLTYEHRPGDVSSDAPAVVLLHGRGTNERDLLPIGARLPDDLEVLGVRAPRTSRSSGSRAPMGSRSRSLVPRPWSNTTAGASEETSPGRCS